MEPINAILGALVPYGPMGVVFGIMLWYIKILHDEARKERDGRLADAERFRELSLELQEKVLVACSQMGAVVDTLVAALRDKRL